MIEEEKEFFIYEDYEDVDVDYSTRNTSKKPKETIVGVEEISPNPVKKGKEEIKKRSEEKKETIKRSSEEVKKELKEVPKERKKSEEKKGIKENPKKEKKQEKEKVKKEVKKEEEKLLVAKEILEDKKGEEPEKVKKEKKKKSNTLTILLAVVAVLLIVVIVLYLRGFFSGALNKDVAATVNNEAITFKELSENYDLIPEEYKLFITKEQVLDQIINQKLLLQEANKKGIVVTEGDIDKEIGDVLKQNLLTVDQFEEMVKERGLSMKDVRDSYRKQIMINTLIEQEIKSKTNISEDKIMEYYNNMIRASHILVNSEEEAKDILEELKSGADFSALAKEKSIDEGSAVKGGDLGEFAKGQMIPEFEEAAFKLKIGEISGVVKTSYGYHIIKRTPKNLTYEEARERIKDLLTAPEQQKIYESYVEGLRKNARIVINLEKENEGIQKTEEELSQIKEGIEEVEETGIEKDIEKVEEELSKECFEKYGATKDTVIFYYADWCMEQEQCKTPKTAIGNLEKQGYKFQLASRGDSILDCFGINENLVPQFICAGTKEVKIGSLTEANLKSFADKCK